MKIIHAIILLFLTTCSFAEPNIVIDGTILEKIKISVKPALHSSRLLHTNASRSIQFLKIKLSDQAKNSLRNKAKNILSHANQAILMGNNLPSKIELGMNKVPVLDQGEHGTCVTFAVSAAYDAVIGRGDYISQLCHLQLGNYLADNGYAVSGWSGSLGRFALAQLDAFGIISKNDEKTYGCGDLNEYPISGEDPTSSISLEAFHKISHKTGNIVSWSPIIDVIQSISNEQEGGVALDKVKKSLAQGDRVILGMMLFNDERGVAGANGSYHANNDTWILSNGLPMDFDNVAGHEMVITGYDNNAQIKDNQGNVHQGLLTLRNSWGSSAGDGGNFYMSYDYFKLLAIEAQRITKVDLTI